ncbi:MAG: hypothetical protein LUB56_02100 [Coprobacillus sp.]|nr:hypothetical protein [Coprobacillus sp.]
MLVVQCYGKNIYYHNDIVGYISRDGIYLYGKKFAELTEDGIINYQGKEVGYVNDDGDVIMNNRTIGYIDADYNFVFEIEIPGLK